MNTRIYPCRVALHLAAAMLLSSWVTSASAFAVVYEFYH
jgi:hypothetical protein